jgi:predicted NUDIX family phosphoesterase
MSVVQTENVLVVPTEAFHRVGYFQGFRGDTRPYLEQLLLPSFMSYRPRDAMEHDPSYKQLIPYVIFLYDGDAEPSVFQYTRGSGQGEQRLHRKRSIGVGGHICTADAAGEDARNPYLEGMRRELDEEVFVDTPYTSRCVGIINDDQTEVGQVHLGIVHLMKVEAPTIRPREPEILDAGFQPVRDLLRELDQMESWSSICLQALFSGTARSHP